MDLHHGFVPRPFNPAETADEAGGGWVLASVRVGGAARRGVDGRDGPGHDPVAGSLRRVALRLGLDAEKAADGVDEFGAVHRVEVEIAHALVHQV